MVQNIYKIKYTINEVKYSMMLNRRMHATLKDISHSTKAEICLELGEVKDRAWFVRLNGEIVVVVLLFYVHGKHLRSCRDGQLT